MAARGRGGRSGSGRGGWGGNSRGRGAAGGSGAAGGRDMACACEANSALLVELRNLDDECLRTGKVKLRYVFPPRNLAGWPCTRGYEHLVRTMTLCCRSGKRLCVGSCQTGEAVGLLHVAADAAGTTMLTCSLETLCRMFVCVRRRRHGVAHDAPSSCLCLRR